MDSKSSLPLKLTSPVNLILPEFSSFRRDIPTSMMQAPGFTILEVIRLGTPTKKRMVTNYNGSKYNEASIEPFQFHKHLLLTSCSHQNIS